MEPTTLKNRKRSLQKLEALKIDSVREQARHAVEHAALLAVQTLTPSQAAAAAADNDEIKRRLSNDSVGSKNSHSSYLSHQRAIHRGSKRGLVEPHDDAASSASFSLEGLMSLDLQPAHTVATGSKTTNSVSAKSQGSKTRRKWSILFKTKQRVPRKGAESNQQSFLASEITNEAWMCGVCAKSFSSFAAAQKHEDYHIQEVVADLGWGPSPSNEVEAPTTSADENVQTPSQGLALEQKPYSHSTPVRTPLIDRSQRESNAHQSWTPSSPHPPRPDMLHMSTPALNFSSRISSYQPPSFTPALQRKRKSRRGSFFDDDNFLEDSMGSDALHESAEFNVRASVRKPMSRSNRQQPMSPINEQKLKSKLTVGIDHQEEKEWMSDEHDLLVPHGMRDYVVLADEALVDVCEKAKPLILTRDETKAETELDYLAQDKAYYDLLYKRSVERRRGGTYDQFRAEGKTILSKVQNKFVDAYQLMKEGNTKHKSGNTDHYTRKLKGDVDATHVLENSKKTLYVNVIVKASLQVVSHELHRLAKQRWEAVQAGNDPQAERFQQFRALAQDNLVKLAGMALAADFTPRRIAVQLSNDLYRLLTPRLKRRGVLIEAEIEYRVGPYFVLAVNVKKVDWRRLVKAAYRDVSEAKKRWILEQEEKNDEEKKTETKPQGVIMSFLVLCYGLTKLTHFEVTAQLLAWCYHFHWTLYTPICFLLYHSFMGELFRRYFLATVSDEIFYYVEQKGMEMDIVIRNASTQAAFMLSALREIRADGRELKKKQEGEDKETILGPLLGPAIKEDKGPAPPKPAGFEMPENLEYVGLELEIPVGFRRLRWALLSSKSTFLTEAVFRAESKYENITVGHWSKHDEEIGLPTLPEGVKDEDIVGAEKELSYLMPKSAFVSANTAYETSYIDVYNDYCFVLRKKALTPEVPYGSSFVAWTKYVVINTGADSCKLICSVEAEFPNGPPMISRQIKGGMRAGVGELFVKVGETINKYADKFP